MNGWIKLHRSITDSAVFEDAEVLKLWIWILCNAAHSDHDTLFYGSVVTVKEGQIVTGRKKISQQIQMPEARVYRALNILKQLGNIDINSNNKFSVITVAKWAFFQSENQKVNSKPTANLQQTHSKPTANLHNIRMKECKEGKECIYADFFEPLWKAYPKQKGKGKITEQAKEEMSKIGADVVMSAIENYKKEIQQNNVAEQYIMHGSTFFNGAWKDYVVAPEIQNKEERKSY
jgi:hypothetical protein